MSMRTAITGLNASQVDLSTIANNIANAATTGFKASRTEFANMIAADAGGTSPGSGVRVVGVTQMMKQGGLESTGNTLDLAINGNGFFMVREGDAVSYTRAGNFRLDTNGDITTSSGGKIQFYSPAVPVQSQTNDTAMKTQFKVTGQQQIASLTVADDTTTGQKTLTVNGGAAINVASGNDADAKVRATTLVESINSKGIAGLTAYVDPTNAEKVSIEYSGAGTVTLGKVSTGTSSDVSAVVTGTRASSLDANEPLDVNGTKYPLTRMDIDSKGVIRATYSNGEIRALGQVVVATFSTPTGLAQLGNTSWGSTFGSGEAQLNAPGVGDRGIIESGVLEASNVEITEQLVDMITAQRNFQANAKMVATADQVAQAVLNIR